MFLEQIPDNAIFIRLGYLEVSAFGRLAIFTVLLLAAILIFRPKLQIRSFRHQRIVRKST